MSKFGKQFNQIKKEQADKIQPTTNSKPPLETVESLYDSIVEGREYESILNKVPKNPNDTRSEITKAIKAIESVTNRPCICYLANVIKPLPFTSIESSDDTPFMEMLDTIPVGSEEIDIVLVTPGGSGQQVDQFVSHLRKRFKKINFILPYMCMSAGTLWVLSADNIIMDERAFIGPIDPQVQASNGQWVPAQSIFQFLDHIKQEGQKAIDKGQPPSWELVRLLDKFDGRVLGNAITASNYSINLAKNYLQNYKFKDWTITETNGTTVTSIMRTERAERIANELCQNSKWMSHGHRINRDVVSKELGIRVTNLEADAQLQKVVRKFWGLMVYVFDKSTVCKLIISKDYAFARSAEVLQPK